MFLVYATFFGLLYIVFSLAFRISYKDSHAISELFDGYPVMDMKCMVEQEDEYSDSENDEEKEQQNEELYLKDSDTYFERLQDDFNELHYMYKINILQYFCDNKNFERLQKILDTKNGILQKINRTIKENEELKEDYQETLDFFEPSYFIMESKIKIPIVILDKTFITSLPQLNYFRWLIDNDYFLHIE